MVRLIPETARHERTLMAWPTATRRAALWHEELETARDDTAQIATLIGAHEPVTLVAKPEDAADASNRCGAGVEVVALDIDDSWMRDSGPIVVADGGRAVALQFRFNAWGEKFTPYDTDATIASRVAEHLSLPVREVPFVLEGGAIAFDGAGTIVTTERCLLHPNRNGPITKAEVEAVFERELGATRVIWLPDAIVEDDGTDGHVDAVVAFASPSLAVLQGCDDEDNANAAVARENRARLEAAAIDVVELTALPYAEVGGREVPVPYVNYYVANGLVAVPVVGHPADDAMLETLEGCYPGRQVVGVPGARLAYGGGGVHCITQPVPVVSGLS
jgi:agmatine deiminase